MTREEAIEVIKLAMAQVEWDYPMDYAAAFDMAIKALEQEPTTKNDLGVDCISRAEAIKCLECDFDITGKENMKTVVNYINSAHDKIVNLPSVTPQPRKGHWVYTPQRRIVDETDDGCVYETDYRCSCSECGGDFGFARVEDSFCKYCGADMREDKE